MFGNEKIIVITRHLSSNSHLLLLFTPKDTSNFINLHGKLFEIKLSDINNDGYPDVLVGISKKVHFDPVVKKRIQIYTYKNHNLQPLWLGTKFVNDVASFSVEQNANLNYLRTTEIDSNGKRIQRIYHWDNFGFSLTK